MCVCVSGLPLFIWKWSGIFLPNNFFFFFHLEFVSNCHVIFWNMRPVFNWLIVLHMYKRKLISIFHENFLKVVLLPFNRPWYPKKITDPICEFRNCVWFDQLLNCPDESDFRSNFVNSAISMYFVRHVDRANSFYSFINLQKYTFFITRQTNSFNIVILFIFVL